MIRQRRLAAAAAAAATAARQRSRRRHIPEEYLSRFVDAMPQHGKLLLVEKQKSHQKMVQKKRQQQDIKFVHNGNYYRIKVPTENSIKSSFQRLRKNLTAAASSSVIGATSAQSPSAASKITTNATDIAGTKTATSIPATVAIGGGGGSGSESNWRTYFTRRRLLKWFWSNLPVLTLNFGSICIMVGFSRSDVIELRSLAMTGQLAFAAYLLSQKKIQWPSIVWSALFAAVNAVKIFDIVHERTAEVHMTEEQQDVFVRYFMPHGITPKQFDRICQRTTTVHLKRGEYLIQRGQRLDHLFLVTEGSTRAYVRNRRLTAASTNPYTKGDQLEGGDSGAWVGEMTFLNKFGSEEAVKAYGNTNNATAAAAAFTASIDTAKINDDDNNTNRGSNGSNSAQPKFQRQQHQEHQTSNNQINNNNINSRSQNRPLIAEDKPGLGVAMYTILAEEDCTVMAWSYDDMKDLMNSSVDLRSALTRAMTSAVVGKVMNMTVSHAEYENPSWSSWLTDWKNNDTSKIQLRDKLRST